MLCAPHILEVAPVGLVDIADGGGRRGGSRGYRWWMGVSRRIGSQTGAGRFTWWPAPVLTCQAALPLGGDGLLQFRVDDPKPVIGGQLCALTFVIGGPPDLKRSPFLRR